MSEAKGISKGLFIAGIIISILASTLAASVFSLQYARGSRGETGPQGLQGIQGEQGPPGNASLSNIAGWLPAPAFDSGWIFVPKNTWFLIQHNLNTRELYVYVIGKEIQNATYSYTYQWIYGEALVWNIDSADNIRIFVDGRWEMYDMVRVMLWKINQL